MFFQSPCFKINARETQDLRRRTEITPVKMLIHKNKCTMMRYRPTCLLLSLIVVRIVTVNANGILVTHGPPAFARGMLSKPQIKGGGHLCGQWPDPKNSTQPNFSRIKKKPSKIYFL
jgi:hypothetical protein